MGETSQEPDPVHDDSKTGWLNEPGDHFQVWKNGPGDFWSFKASHTHQKYTITWHIRTSAISYESDIGVRIWRTNAADTPAGLKNSSGVVTYTDHKEWLDTWGRLMENPIPFMMIQALSCG